MWDAYCDYKGINESDHLAEKMDVNGMNLVQASAIYEDDRRDKALDALEYGVSAKLSSKSSNLCSCFVAGTLITTESGKRPIESIKAGEFVYSENPKNGTKGLKRVVRAFIRQADKLVNIKVGGTTIKATFEHPFWVANKGWTKASLLCAGDKLVLLNGNIVVIEMVQHEILETPVNVYNFEVEDFHTYFVGQDSVLVHNACRTPDSHPNEFSKQRGNQGLKDAKGNTWKKDQLHKDHWDISNKKGDKIQEVDFKGNVIWPNGPKNKNKK